MKPVIAAAASCHTPNPRGIRRTAKGVAIEARMEVFSANDGVADQDDGSCLDDVCFRTLHHGLESKFQAGNLKLGKLHDEEGSSVLIAGDTLD